MSGNFFANYIFVSAFLLFAIGFSMLVFQRNLIKKIIGLDIIRAGELNLKKVDNKLELTFRFKGI